MIHLQKESNRRICIGMTDQNMRYIHSIILREGDRQCTQIIDKDIVTLPWLVPLQLT